VTDKRTKSFDAAIMGPRNADKTAQYFVDHEDGRETHKAHSVKKR
jgi:hypothetical protein